jgi:hypothetical protein
MFDTWHMHYRQSSAVYDKALENIVSPIDGKRQDLNFEQGTGFMPDDVAKAAFFIYTLGRIKIALRDSFEDLVSFYPRQLHDGRVLSAEVLPWDGHSQDTASRLTASRTSPAHGALPSVLRSTSSWIASAGRIARDAVLVVW